MYQSRQSQSSIVPSCLQSALCCATDLRTACRHTTNPSQVIIHSSSTFSTSVRMTRLSAPHACSLLGFMSTQTVDSIPKLEAYVYEAIAD